MHRVIKKTNIYSHLSLDDKIDHSVVGYRNRKLHQVPEEEESRDQAKGREPLEQAEQFLPAHVWPLAGVEE